MADAQIERAFQKQEGVFLNSKKVLAKKTTSGVRFYKKVGLGKCLDNVVVVSDATGAFASIEKVTYLSFP